MEVDKKSCFSTCWIWPLSAVTSSYLHVVGRKSDTDFRLTLIRETLAQAGHESWPSMPVGRPAQASSNIGRLDTCHNKHWPGCSETKHWCCVYSAGAWSEPSYLDVWSVTWRFVLTETVFRIITQRPRYNTSVHPSSMQTVEALTTI